MRTDLPGIKTFFFFWVVVEGTGVHLIDLNQIITKIKIHFGQRNKTK